MQCQFDRSGLKFRKLCRLAEQSIGNIEFEIDELSAIIADRMVMPRQISVIPGHIRAKANLPDQALIFQISKRIVNRRERDAGKALAGPLEDLVGG